MIDPLDPPDSIVGEQGQKYKKTRLVMSTDQEITHTSLHTYTSTFRDCDILVRARILVY